VATPGEETLQEKTFVMGLYNASSITIRITQSDTPSNESQPFIQNLEVEVCLEQGQ